MLKSIWSGAPLESFFERPMKIWLEVLKRFDHLLAGSYTIDPEPRLLAGRTE